MDKSQILLIIMGIIIVVGLCYNLGHHNGWMEGHTEGYSWAEKCYDDRLNDDCSAKLRECMDSRVEWITIALNT